MSFDRQPSIRGQVPPIHSPFYRILFGIIGFIIVLTVLLSFTQISAGYVGVVRQFGAVKPNVLHPGIHMVAPWIQSVEHVHIRLEQIDAETGAASKDSQEVRTKVAVSYSLDPAYVAAMIQEAGSRENLEQTTIRAGILESVKAVTARYTAEDLLLKRSEVKTAMQDTLNAFIDQSLKPKRLDQLVLIANVAVVNFDFSDVVTKAIEDKVKEQQTAIQRRTRADTEAYEKMKAADADAYKEKAEGEARAFKIAKEGEAIRSNPSIIQLRYAERWDGVLPRMTGGGSIPFINFDADVKPVQPPR